MWLTAIIRKKLLCHDRHDQHQGNLQGEIWLKLPTVKCTKNGLMLPYMHAFRGISSIKDDVHSVTSQIHVHVP